MKNTVTNKNRPIQEAIGYFIKNKPFFAAVIVLATVAILGITIGDIRKEVVKALAPQHAFSYAAADATKKYIDTEGDCSFISIEPSRIGFPQGCKLKGLDIK